MSTENEKKNLFIKIGQFISNNLFLYYVLNYTWGLLGTLLGHLIFVILKTFGKLQSKDDNPYLKQVHFLKSNTGYCFSVGTTIIASNVIKDWGRNKYLDHEYGHCVQNAILGPLVFFLVYIPSAIRYWYKYFKEKKGVIFGPDWYDSIWFEGTATELGVYFINCRRIIVIKY